MRERKLVLEGSTCDTNLYDDGPMTVEEATQRGPQPCPHSETCWKNGFLHPVKGHQCVMDFGRQLAANILRDNVTIDVAARDFHKQAPHPPKGFVWSPDRLNFKIVTDRDEAIRHVREFAVNILKKDQKEELKRNVGSDFKDVLAHASRADGSLDVAKMQGLEGRFGSNGGRGCDVTSGPCSCGAWH